MSILTTDSLVKKEDLQQTRFVEGEIDLDDLQSGQVFCRVEKFAFTNINITYAKLGYSRLRYWHFFPTSEEGWGKLPVWGFADVIHSNHEAALFAYFAIRKALRLGRSQ